MNDNSWLDKIRNIFSEKVLGKKSFKISSRNYYTPTDSFVNWVNGLGIEKTWFGRLVYWFESNLKLRLISYLFVFTLLLAFLIHFESDLVYRGLKEGDVALVNIKSPSSFEIVDEFDTAKKRIEAEESVPPVFDYDSEKYVRIMERLGPSFRLMRNVLAQNPLPKKIEQQDLALNSYLRFKKDFENSLEITGVDDEVFFWLVQKSFSFAISKLSLRIMESFIHLKVASDLSPFESSNYKQIILRHVDSFGHGNEKTMDISELTDIASLKRSLDLNYLSAYTKLSNEEKRFILRFVSSLISPNISISLQDTATRKQNARSAVAPVKIQIKKNQVLVSEGNVVQAKDMMILNHIIKMRDKNRTEMISLVTAFLLLVLILTLFSYVARFSITRVKVSTKDLATMGVITLIVVFLIKIVQFFTDSSALRELGFQIPEQFFLFVAPLAAGPMLVGLLMTYGEVVWLYTLFLSSVVGIMMGFNFNALLVALIGGVAGARGVYACKSRNHIYWAGIRTGLINMLVIFCLGFLSYKDATVSYYLWCLPAGLFSGIFSALITMMIVPLLESVFNYTTDVKLLELSNLNHPLMKEMLMRAPGTYHHSVIVGHMAESAAEEIGANPLLSKVGSYFHDIGKIAHAEYFVENQRMGHNPHDNVSPNMSKTILIAHVKDGVELGEKFKLGKPIIDIIQQHHGTTLISYFYNKAKEMEDDLHTVEEAEFRYPGPKPQFREAGLVMLADSIEAAARSIDDPTPARLQNLVKNIIQNKFLDAQLDECNLTLRDLSTIEKVYERVLLTQYHHRIDYPVQYGGISRESSRKDNVANIQPIRKRD